MEKATALPFPTRLLATLALVALTSCIGSASPITFGGLDASLDTGSLAGTKFFVSFSYDAGQISPIGDSYINLNSFDFTLLGAVYSHDDINEGGQAIFHDGVLNNVTASIEGATPPGFQVNNITFGFGEPGGIGYIDLAGNFGSGSFRFATVPEPRTSTLLFTALGVLLFSRLKRRKAILRS